MRPITIQQIRQAVGGKAISSIPSKMPAIAAICTDSRRMESSSLFIALRGEKFDGHDYLPIAAAGGAIAALVEYPPKQQLPNIIHILVPDTRKALGKLARFVRNQMSSDVIGVAGSNGKTSTKNLIHAALRHKLNGSISPKSFNNEIGVPLTIFPADPNQDYLVLEMGTNHPGEIKVLTEMALPDIAVITNCGPEHLEGLGDLMGVRRENASIIKGLQKDGLLVVNGDDEELLDAVSGYPGRRITFGFKESNDLFATDIDCTEQGVRFKLNNRNKTVFVPMLGRHTACNALAAIAVARRMGLDEDAIIQALATAQGPEMRLQLQHVRGMTLINDAYNANPASMKAALDTIHHLPHPGRRVAVLGDMRELGEGSDQFHREIGQYAAQIGLDLLICVGEKSRFTAESAIREGMKPKTVLTFDDARSAAAQVPSRLRKGDLILLKASRGIHLEHVAEAIIAPPPRRAAG